MKSNDLSSTLGNAEGKSRHEASTVSTCSPRNEDPGAKNSPGGTLTLAGPFSEPITDEWLKSIGFRWHDVERSGKHWMLWLGDALEGRGFTGREDLGLELSLDYHKEFYYCWLRGDYSHRYSRFIHIRHLKIQRELIRLIEALTGLDWKPENVWYGGLVTDKHAAYLRKEKERLDRRFVEGSHPWNNCEKDESRGYELNHHQDLIRDKEEGPKK